MKATEQITFRKAQGKRIVIREIIIHIGQKGVKQLDESLSGIIQEINLSKE